MVSVSAADEVAAADYDRNLPFALRCPVELFHYRIEQLRFFEAVASELEED